MHKDLTPSGTSAVAEAYELLCDYLRDFPEHDQADFRVYRAAEILEHALLPLPEAGEQLSLPL